MIGFWTLLTAVGLTVASSELRGQTPPPATAAAQQAEVQKFIATLQSPTAAQFDKVEACRQLAVFGTKDAVPALAALLSDEKLAHMARYALEPLPDPAAGDALRAALGQLQGKLQAGVINSLGVRRDAKAVEALIQLLTNPDPEVATAAAAALGRIGNSKCAQALQPALGQATPATRAALADACLVCAERLLAQNERRQATGMYDFLLKTDLPGHLRMAAMRGAILTRESAGLALLLEQLKSSDASMVAVALRVVREMPGKGVTKALASELGALPEEKQVLLLLALGDHGDKAALPAVLALTKNGAPKTRVAALRALAKLGDASAVPALLAAAGDPDREVAQAAQATVAMLPGADMDKALLTSLRRGETGSRRAAIAALAQRRVTAAVPELILAAADPDAGVRVEALKALGETVGPADLGVLTEALVKAKSPDETAAANAALAAVQMRIQDKPAIAGKLLAVLPHAGPQAKSLLLLQLGQVGGAGALQAVRAATQDPDSAIRDSAVRALADWPDASAAPELAGIVRATPDKALRVVAFRGYVRLATESEAPIAEKLKLLEQASGLAADAQDRKLILSALGETGSVGALQLVAGYLADPELVDEAGAAAVKLSAKLGAPSKAEIAPVLNQVLKSARAKSVLDGARAQLTKLGLAVQ
jgi:HEAT repeat protein